VISKQGDRRAPVFSETRSFSAASHEINKTTASAATSNDVMTRAAHRPAFSSPVIPPLRFLDAGQSRRLMPPRYQHIQNRRSRLREKRVLRLWIFAPYYAKSKSNEVIPKRTIVARVTLIDEKDHPELSESVAKIKGARGGRLINIYRLMLHSPALANAWFDLNQAVRYGTQLDGQSRELAVIRVAILNQVEYVQRAHGPAYALKEGLTPQQVAAIEHWPSSPLFSEPQRALLAYADAMTRQIEVPDSIFAEVRKHFTERQTVELTMLIAAYNMLTRFLKALRVDPEPPSGVSS
jgi:alkylhydroperoxidase family enzyme